MPGDAGHEVVFATERAGTVPAVGPRLLTGVRFGRLGARAGPVQVRAALDRPEQFERGPRAGTARGTATDDSAAFVVEDGHYLSARRPGDAHPFARRFTGMPARAA